MTQLIDGYGSQTFGTLRVIALDEITIGERGRKDYGDLNQLKLSIAKHGLIHPIAVYSPSGLPPYQLAAGGRRLEACRALSLKGISCRVYDHELSPRDLKAIELFENLDRKELSYAEKLAMEQELHDLLVSIEGTKLPGSSANAGGHRMADTARLLGKDVSSLSKDFELGRMIKAHPELGLDKLKNKTQAQHVLKRLGAALGNKVLIKEKAKETSSLEQRLLDSYIVGDFFANSLEAESFSFIECDPPYGIDLQHFRSASDKELLNSQYIEISEVEYSNFLYNIASECYKLATQNAWMVLWCGPQHYTNAVNALEGSGWTHWRIPAIWIKAGVTVDTLPGQSLNPQLYLGNSYEMFIYARKGNAQLHTLGHSNVFNYQPVFPGHKIHPAERPAALIRDLLSVFCWPGSRVLVPFAGSGRTLIEAYNLNFPTVGFDLSQEFKEAFSARILGGKEVLLGSKLREEKE